MNSYLRLIVFLTAFVILAGCAERKHSQKDAIIKSINFHADKTTIKETFAKLPTMSASEGKMLLWHTLGKDNLSVFLLTQTFDLTNCFSFFIDPASTVAMRRCATAGKSLISYADLANIELSNVGNSWRGSFSFNVENSYTGVCNFDMIETDRGFLVTRLSIPRRKNELSVSNLVVFSIENIEHLRMNRNRRYFKEMQ